MPNLTTKNAKMPNLTTKENNHIKLFLFIKDLSIYTPTRNIMVGLLYFAEYPEASI